MKTFQLTVLLALVFVSPSWLEAVDEKPVSSPMLPGVLHPQAYDCPDKLVPPSVKFPLGAGGALAAAWRQYFNVLFNGEVLGKPIPLIRGVKTFFVDDLGAAARATWDDYGRTHQRGKQDWERRNAAFERSFNNWARKIDWLWGLNTESLNKWWTWTSRNVFNYSLNIFHWPKVHYVDRVGKDWILPLTGQWANIPEVWKWVGKRHKELYDETERRAKLTSGLAAGWIRTIGGARRNIMLPIGGLLGGTLGVVGGTILFVPVSVTTHAAILGANTVAAFPGSLMWGVVTVPTYALMKTLNLGHSAVRVGMNLGASTIRHGFATVRTGGRAVVSLLRGIQMIATAPASFVLATGYGTSVHLSRIPRGVIRAVRDRFIYPAFHFEVDPKIAIEGETHEEILENMGLVARNTSRMVESIQSEYSVKRTILQRNNPNFGSDLELSDRESGAWVATLRVQTNRGKISITGRVSARYVKAKWRERVTDEKDLTKQQVRLELIGNLARLIENNLERPTPKEEQVRVESGVDQDPVDLD